MTKKKLNEAVLALCDKYKAPKELRAALNGLTEPKAGGSSDVNDYTVFDKDGKPAFIFCTYHKKWEPLKDKEGKFLFKVDEKSKNGFRRYCDEGDLSWRASAKAYKASKTAIMDDLLEGKLSGPEAKKELAKIEEIRAVHADRKDKLGSDKRPE